MPGKSMNKSPKANQSFADLVGKTNRDALKPEIAKQVAEQMRDLGNQLNANMMQVMSSMQVRITGIERILMEKHNLSEEDIREGVAIIEDEAMGLEKLAEVTGVVQVGDTLRAELSVRNPKVEEEWPKPYRQEFPKIGESPHQTTKEFETELMGMKVGETKEIVFDEKTLVRITAERISRPIPKPKVASEPSQENSNG